MTTTANATNAGATGTALNNLGAVEKALLDAMDQIQTYVAASQVGPDGKPSGTALYMQMPMGYPVDPDDFFDAWTPMGGAAAQYEDLDGRVLTPPTPAPSTVSTGTASAGGSSSGDPAPSTAPSVDELKLDAAFNSAFNTCALVDDMLEVTDKGVAVSWPSMTTSVQWTTIINAATPGQVGTVDPAEQALVTAAYKLLWNDDGQGNVYQTSLYQNYQTNQTAYANAVAAHAAAYAAATASPAAGAVWPVEAATYETAITQALDNWNAEGRVKVESALATLNAEGQNSAATIISLAKNTMQTWTVDLGGAVGAPVPWSYITPSHWWDHNDESIGVQKLSANNSLYDASAASGANTFSSDWMASGSSSTSGGASASLFGIGGGASASHSSGASAFDEGAQQNSSSHSTAAASSAKVTAEYFMAVIHRPWMLADLLHMPNWYGFGWKKNQISDGTVSGQITPTQLNSDDATGDKIMPMIPKAFVIMRNVAITADDWGDAGSAFSAAQQQASGSAQSQSTDVGASVSYLFASGNFNHHDQSSSSGAEASSGLRTGWSYQAAGQGGTLTMHGSQIIGWIGEVMPASPPLDAPAANTATTTSATSATGNGS